MDRICCLKKLLFITVSDATVTQTIRGSGQKLLRGWQVIAWNHEGGTWTPVILTDFALFVCMCVSRFLFMCNTKAGVSHPEVSHTCQQSYSPAADDPRHRLTIKQSGWGLRSLSDTVSKLQLAQVKLSFSFISQKWTKLCLGLQTNQKGECGGSRGLL